MRPAVARVSAAVPGDALGATEPTDEQQLVARVRAGDVDAYDTLVRRYLERALAIARRVLGNPIDAEDLVQDAFLRALDRISTFDPARQRFAPWFFRLLINTGLNTRRSRAVRATEPELLDARSSDAMPDELLERREIRDRFAAAVAKLPPRQQTIVTLYEVDGLSAAEIAQSLDIAPETVRWHLHEARRALRLALAPLRD